MSDEKSHGKVKGGLGLLGVVATIVSVWWFALRPRRRQRNEE
jgi:hypothetical protein